MQPLEEVAIDCPNCGERVSVLVDTSIPEQHYSEDCEVCCAPIALNITVSAQTGLSVQADPEDESRG